MKHTKSRSWKSEKYWPHLCEESPPTLYNFLTCCDHWTLPEMLNTASPSWVPKAALGCTVSALKLAEEHYISWKFRYAESLIYRVSTYNKMKWDKVTFPWNVHISYFLLLFFQIWPLFCFWCEAITFTGLSKTWRKGAFSHIPLHIGNFQK